MTASSKAMKAALSGNRFDKNFGAFGVAVYNASGEMRSLKDIFTDMNAAMDGMTTQQRDSLIQDVACQLKVKYPENYPTGNAAKRS